MTRLETLSIFNNFFSGPLPKTIGSLKSLQTLMANDNALEGPLPPELGSLTNLSMLSLFGNVSVRSRSMLR